MLSSALFFIYQKILYNPIGDIMKIFIVEDDFTIASLLSSELNSWSYSTYIASDFNNIMEEFNRDFFDLVLLDIGLPNYNGYYWCERIKEVSNVPIIFLSSRNENMDIIMALNMGADDYITKPLDINVTLTKIRAILRRAYGMKIETDSLNFHGIKYDLLKNEITNGENSTFLTKTEGIIFSILIKNGGEISTRESILDVCWGNGDFIDDNTLNVNMVRLRKKLRDIGADNLIVTKKGVGYCLNENFRGN